MRPSSARQRSPTTPTATAQTWCCSWFCRPSSKKGRKCGMYLEHKGEGEARRGGVSAMADSSATPRAPSQPSRGPPSRSAPSLFERSLRAVGDRTDGHERLLVHRRVLGVEHLEEELHQPVGEGGDAAAELLDHHLQRAAEQALQLVLLLAVVGRDDLSGEGRRVGRGREGGGRRAGAARRREAQAGRSREAGAGRRWARAKQRDTASRSRRAPAGSGLPCAPAARMSSRACRPGRAGPRRGCRGCRPPTARAPC